MSAVSARQHMQAVAVGQYRLLWNQSMGTVKRYPLRYSGGRRGGGNATLSFVITIIDATVWQHICAIDDNNLKAQFIRPRLSTWLSQGWVKVHGSNHKYTMS